MPMSPTLLTPITMASNIKMLLAKAAKIHPCIIGKPTDDDIYKIMDVLFPPSTAPTTTWA